MAEIAHATATLDLQGPLPAKLWEQVFRHLSTLPLLRLRAVCRQWRDLITASPLLRNRFAGVLTGDRMDRNYRPEEEQQIVPVGHLQLGGFTISAGAGSWWIGYGPGLTELTLLTCTMTVPALYGLLKHTPNLKDLDLDDVSLTGSARPDFRLDKLVCFTMNNVKNKPIPRDFLVRFERFFPRLKTLRLQSHVVRHEMVAGVIESIRALQDSLENLELLNGQFLDALCKMDRLRLKWISCYIDFASEVWTEFCRKQPQLEKIQISAESCQMVRNIARALPSLKELPLDLFRSMKADFLNDMPNLEIIDINGSFHELDFRAAANPKLKVFNMLNTTATKLIQYLKKAPNLRFLTVHECTLIGDSCNLGTFTNLWSLVLSSCKLPPALILALCCQNPQLKRVHLRFLRGLTDEMFAKICQQLPRVRQLALVSCEQITDAAGECIVRYCRELEKLQLHGVTLSAESAGLLKERHVRIRRWVWPYPFDPVGGFAEEEED